MKEQAGNRIAFLDALKAVSIMLVVYCHYPLLSNESFVGNIVMTLAWGAVPCFMMVSGALMHSKSTFVWKKYFTRLVKTYIVFCVWRIVYLLTFMNINNVKPGKGQVLRYIFMFEDIPGIDVSVLWFMIAYMICLLVYPLTYHAFKNRERSAKYIRIFLIVLLFYTEFIINALAWVGSLIKDVVPFHIPEFKLLLKIMPMYNYSNMLFFFMLGSLLFDNREKVKKWFERKNWIPPVMIVAGIVGLMCIKFADYHLWTWGGQYMKLGYSRISTVILAVGMFFCFEIFEFNKLYDIMGRMIGCHTMGIYYLHWFVLALVSKYFYGKLPDYFFGMNLIKTIIVTAICVLISIIIKKIPVLKNLVS